MESVADQQAAHHAAFIRKTILQQKAAAQTENIFADLQELGLPLPGTGNATAVYVSFKGDDLECFEGWRKELDSLSEFHNNNMLRIGVITAGHVALNACIVLIGQSESKVVILGQLAMTLILMTTTSINLYNCSQLAHLNKVMVRDLYLRINVKVSTLQLVAAYDTDAASNLEVNMLHSTVLDARNLWRDCKTHLVRAGFWSSVAVSVGVFSTCVLAFVTTK